MRRDAEARGRPREYCEAFRARFGLDEPLPYQLAIYLGQIASGDLGESIQLGRPVTELLAPAVADPIELAFFALVFAIGRRHPARSRLGVRRNSQVDVGTMFVANVGISVPVFVLGLRPRVHLRGRSSRERLRAAAIRSALPGVSVAAGRGVGAGGSRGAPPLLDFMSSIYIARRPAHRPWDGLVDSFRHLILPAVALGTIPLAIIARITRSSLLDVLGLDYIRTARAKGLDERHVVFRHAIRNALLPGRDDHRPAARRLLGGAVLTETIFNLAGVGRTLYDAITARDYAVIQGFTSSSPSGYVLVNLLIDVSYAWLDPRIRLAMSDRVDSRLRGHLASETEAVAAGSLWRDT